tara:strand:- start:1769 stop:1960 length:192 start_codon:yes stop_codon:yes gene_type:complete
MMVMVMVMVIWLERHRLRGWLMSLTKEAAMMVVMTVMLLLRQRPFISLKEFFLSLSNGAVVVY